MAQNKQTQFDSEYSALMAELGEGAAPGAANVPAGAVTAAPTQDRLPPWRIPENWMPGEWPASDRMSDN
jgi:splicing factor 1